MSAVLAVTDGQHADPTVGAAPYGSGAWARPMVPAAPSAALQAALAQADGYARAARAKATQKAYVNQRGLGTQE